MKISGAAIQRFLEKPDKQVRAVLLHGPNYSVIAEAAQRLAAIALGKSDDPYAITKLGEDEIKRDGARLSDALAAQSLLGGPTIVWARVNGKSADAALLAALAEGERGEAGGYLIVEAGDLGSKAELVAAFEKAKGAASIAFYEESDADRASFAKTRARELGVSFARGAEDALIGALPEDRGLARSEIEKLALYAHGLGRPIEATDVDIILAAGGESALDAASRAAVEGQAALAVEALARLDSVSGVSALRALLGRLLQLREARALVDAGVNPSEAVGKLRPPVFWKDREAVTAQTRMWSAKSLTAALEALWAAELRAKTAGAPQELIAADAYRAVAKLAKR